VRKKLAKQKCRRKKVPKKQLEIKIVQYLSLATRKLPLPLDYDLSESTKPAMTTRTLPLSRASLSLSSSLSSRCPERARSDHFLC
jgi:hypothetical protein